MAAELQADSVPGATIYFLLLDVAARRFRTTAAAFEAYDASHYANYAVAGTEQGSTGYFVANLPAGAGASELFLAKLQAGGSPAESDLTVGYGLLGFDNGISQVGLLKLMARVMMGNRSRANGVETFRDLGDTADALVATLSSDGRTITSRNPY